MLVLPHTRKAVSDFLADRIAGQYHVGTRAYRDDDGASVVAVLEASDAQAAGGYAGPGSPAPGPSGAKSAALDVASTASLHAVSNLLDGEDIRVELMMAATRDIAPALGNIVATAGFCLGKSQWLAAPGVVYPDLVGMYFPRVEAKHVMWVEPVDFPDLSTFEVPGLAHPIHMLQGIAITDAEWDLLRTDGFHALAAQRARTHP